MQKTLFTVFVMCVLWVAMPFAQATPNVTVQLRDGAKFEGRIEELTAERHTVRQGLAATISGASRLVTSR